MAETRPPNVPPPAPSFTPEPYDDLPTTLRHAFLWRFQHEEEREAVKRVAEILHAHLLDTGQAGPDPAGTETRQELEAASADLMECANDLRTLAEDRRKGRLHGEDFDLSEKAETWAGEAAALARRIWEALTAGEASHG